MVDRELDQERSNPFLPGRLRQPFINHVLTERQQRIVAEAWDVDPERLFYAVWDIDHALEPVSYLLVVCRSILAESEPAVELPPALRRILRDDIAEALTRAQRSRLAEAWDVQSDALRHKMARVEQSQAPVRLLMRICDENIATYSVW